MDVDQQEFQEKYDSQMMQEGSQGEATINGTDGEQVVIINDGNGCNKDKLTSPSSSPNAVSHIRAKRKLEDGESSNASYEDLVREIEKARERLMDFLVNETEIVDNVSQGQRIIDEMMENKTAVGVDCEGVNLGDRNSGKVTLVQLCDLNKKVFIFDVQAEPELEKELKRLLEAEDIIKVMHDCKCDSEGLYSQCGIQIKNIFDTQSAHIVIKKRTDGECTHADKNVGIDVVCNEYGGAPNLFKDKIKGVYKKNQRYWAARPLNRLMISYAASDVLCLVPTVYNELNSRITSEEDKELLQELSNQQISKIRSRPTLQPKSRSKNYRGGGGGGGHGRGGGGYGRGRSRANYQGWNRGNANY